MQPIIEHDLGFNDNRNKFLILGFCQNDIFLFALVGIVFYVVHSILALFCLSVLERKPDRNESIKLLCKSYHCIVHRQTNVKLVFDNGV